MRLEGVDSVEKVGPLGLDLVEAVLAVEERVEVDLAGARDAGPDVAAERCPPASVLIVLVVLVGGSADKPPMRRRTVP